MLINLLFVVIGAFLFWRSWYEPPYSMIELLAKMFLFLGFFCCMWDDLRDGWQLFDLYGSIGFVWFGVSLFKFRLEPINTHFLRGFEERTD